MRKSTPGSSTRPKRAKKRVLRYGGLPENPAFLAFVRTLPCILIGLTAYAPLGTLQIRHVCRFRVEASHVGRAAMGLKAADETCLPMCSEAHRLGPFAYHKSAPIFWIVWGLNKERLVSETRAAARAAGIHVAEGVVL